jgi:hypothetical protein
MQSVKHKFLEDNAFHHDGQPKTLEGKYREDLIDTEVIIVSDYEGLPEPDTDNFTLIPFENVLLQLNQTTCCIINSNAGLFNVDLKDASYGIIISLIEKTSNGCKFNEIGANVQIDNKGRWIDTKLAALFDLNKPINHIEKDNILKIVKNVSAIFQIIASTNTELVEESAPLKLNKSRLKKGKCLISNHYVIKISKEKKKNKESEKNKSGTPKKAHRRRSHIRTYNRSLENQYQKIIPRAFVGLGKPSDREYII